MVKNPGLPAREQLDGRWTEFQQARTGLERRLKELGRVTVTVPFSPVTVPFFLEQLDESWTEFQQARTGLEGRLKELRE